MRRQRYSPEYTAPINTSSETGRDGTVEFDREGSNAEWRCCFPEFSYGISRDAKKTTYDAEEALENGTLIIPT